MKFIIDYIKNCYLRSFTYLILFSITWIITGFIFNHILEMLYTFLLSWVACFWFATFLNNKISDIAFISIFAIFTLKTFSFFSSPLNAADVAIGIKGGFITDSKNIFYSFVGIILFGLLICLPILINQLTLLGIQFLKNYWTQKMNYKETLK